MGKTNYAACLLSELSTQCGRRIAVVLCRDGCFVSAACHETRCLVSPSTSLLFGFPILVACTCKWHGPPSAGWLRLWRNEPRDHPPTPEYGKALSLSSRPCIPELLTNHRPPIRTCLKLSNTLSSAGRSRRRGLRSQRRQKLLPRETVRFFKLDTDMHILE